MKGGIYSSQRCPICGGKFRSFEPVGMWCPDHPDQRPTRMRVKFGEINKNIHDYTQAYKYLNGVRYETDMGKFDIRDHQRDNPLGFENLTRKFLDRKKHLKGVKKYEQRLRFAVNEWGNRNVKEIGFADIEDLLFKLEHLSSKYRFDILSTLKMFYRGLFDRQEISNIPKFPKVKPIMAFRKILTKDQQQAVLDEIYRLTWDLNPRIYIAVQFLATYINCRPAELLNIKEKDIEIENERILIRNPKEGTPKYIFLIREDVEMLNSMPRSFPEMYFFRHIKGNGAALRGGKFGKDYLYKQWRVACDNLGLGGVSLYPGTRHTTAVAMRGNKISPESIKRAMGTKSNKAFERYLQVTGNELRTLYQDTRPGRVVRLEDRKNDKS